MKYRINDHVFELYEGNDCYYSKTADVWATKDELQRLGATEVKEHRKLPISKFEDGTVFCVDESSLDYKWVGNRVHYYSTLSGEWLPLNHCPRWLVNSIGTEVL